MKKMVYSGLVGILAITLTFLVANPASAWYMGRLEHYTLENLPTKATMNTLEDNPFWGDERQFVRIVEKYKDGTYARTLTIEPGKQYEVYVYYNNDANNDYNILHVEDSTGEHAGEVVGDAVATSVRAWTSFPKELKKGEEKFVQAWVGSDAKAEAKIIASDDLKIFPVEGSAKLYNHWNQQGVVLPSDFFTYGGTPIGLATMNGVIPGSEKYSGHISYTIQTTLPDGSIPNLQERIAEMNAWNEAHKNTSDGQGLPSALPETGAIQIVLVSVLLAVVGGGTALFVRSSRKIKRIMKK